MNSFIHMGLNNDMLSAWAKVVDALTLRHVTHFIGTNYCSHWGYYEQYLRHSMQGFWVFF